MDYLELLDRLHAALQPEGYLEIGVWRGTSLALSRSPSIAIDPAPQLEPKALLGKPWVKLYQQPSDAFFRDHDAEAVLHGQRLDLVLIDGWHEFAQVVRDLEHVERWGHAETVVVIHDVLPRGAWEAPRAYQAGGWTGDVWRIVPFLREHRPDLSCRLLDAAPTGALVVRNLDPTRQGMADVAAASDRDFPLDGPEYQRLVAAFLAQTTPETAEALLRDLPDVSRSIPHRLERQGWLRRPVTGAWQPKQGTETPLRIAFTEPVRLAFRIQLTLTLGGMEILRLSVNSSGTGNGRERNVYVDVERPGALRHDLERVALYANPSLRFFELELEGALAPGEELTELAMTPVDADFAEAPITPDMAIGLDRVNVEQTAWPRAGTRMLPERFDEWAAPLLWKQGKRDAVIFAWYVPERMPELGEYYLGLLRYYHPDSKIFVGMNHGSDPVWAERLRASGLDIEVRLARPQITVTSDVTGFLTALEAYHACNEVFDLVWFGHTKGASQGSFHAYEQMRYDLLRRFWAGRPGIERIFADPRVGIFAPRFSPLPTGIFGDELQALERIYRDKYAPIGLHAKDTFFVLRDPILRQFCEAVGADFFHTPPEDYGASRWFFEIGFPNIASMQGYEPFIDPDVAGEGHPRDDAWLRHDPKQNHRLAQNALDHWRANPVIFAPSRLREAFAPLDP